MPSMDQGGSSSSRPDLVRLADLVKHASLVLSQPSSSDRPKKYTRSRRGCLTCRKAKVKCDEVSPRCLRCAGMGRECAWERTIVTSEGPHGQSSFGANPAPSPPILAPTFNAPAATTIVPVASSATKHVPSGSSMITPPNPPAFHVESSTLSPLSNTSGTVTSADYTTMGGDARSEIPSWPATSTASTSKRKRKAETPAEWEEFMNFSRSPSADISSPAGNTIGDSDSIQLGRSSTQQSDDGTALVPWQSTGCPKVSPHPTLSLTLASLNALGTFTRPSTSRPLTYNIGPSLSLDPFMHAFPTASSQGLFKHYVDNTSGIVTAMGRTKPGQNPFLAVSLPLILTTDTTPACAALRFALLTTAAAHILHLRGGKVKEVADLGDRLKKLAVGYTVISQNSLSEQDADLILAASVVLITRDVLSADKSWRANLDFAIQSIRKRGGPAVMMASDPTSFTKRFILEQIVTHEVFSCFTTGGEPTLLEPRAAWWFDVEKSSSSEWHWESVEQLFGVSRAMVEVISRICSLCARKGRLGVDLSKEPEMAPVATFLRNEAELLIQEMDNFGIALRSLPLHRRVQYGDHIYRMVMSLHLMTEILGLTGDHPRVRAIVPAALELCSEISMQPVMLVWPLLILAKVANMEEREWLKMLLKTYSEQYCRDLQAAQEIILELWTRQDRGEQPLSWTTLMTECDRFVMLI